MSGVMPEVTSNVVTTLTDNLTDAVAQYNCLTVSCDHNVGSKASFTSELLIEAGKALEKVSNDGNIKRVAAITFDLYDGVIEIYYQSNG